MASNVEAIRATIAEFEQRRSELEARLRELITAGQGPSQGAVPLHVSQPLTFAANANEAWKIEGRVIVLDDRITDARAALAAALPRVPKLPALANLPALACPECFRSGHVAPVVVGDAFGPVPGEVPGADLLCHRCGASWDRRELAALGYPVEPLDLAAAERANDDTTDPSTRHRTNGPAVRVGNAYQPTFAGVR